MNKNDHLYNERCIWCGEYTLSELRVPISRYKGKILKFRYCDTCGIKQASSYVLLKVDYNDVQQKHIGYSIHSVDNEWINHILKKGQEDYWTQLAIDFLCTRTMDSQYRHAMAEAIKANQTKTKLKVLEI